MAEEKVGKLFEEFACQRFNADYLVLLTVSGSTIRAFQKGKAYNQGSPLKIYRDWMRQELDAISKYQGSEFSWLYERSYESLAKFWKNNAKINLATPKDKYLLYKLLDLFYKHAGLYISISKNTRECILMNATPPIDSLVLVAIKQERSPNIKSKHAALLDSISKNPRMGNPFKKNDQNFTDHTTFRTACHAYFKDWAIENNAPPLAFDLVAWNRNSKAIN